MRLTMAQAARRKRVWWHCHDGSVARVVELHRVGPNYRVTLEGGRQFLADRSRVCYSTPHE